MAAADHLSAEQIGALANAAIMDRMNAFGSSYGAPQGKNGPLTKRHLTPTAAEDAWDAIITPAVRTPVDEVGPTHPGVIALASKIKSQRRRR